MFFFILFLLLLFFLNLLLQFLNGLLARYLSIWYYFLKRLLPIFDIVLLSHDLVHLVDCQDGAGCQLHVLYNWEPSMLYALFLGLVEC